MGRMRKTSGAIVLILIAVAVGIGIMVMGGPIMPPGESQAATSLTIQYADGSEKEVDPLKNPLAMLGLRVTDSSGKEVSAVKWSVKIKVYYDGEIENIDYSGSSVYVAVNMVTKEVVQSGAFSGVPSDGIWKTVVSRTVQASELEQWAGGDGSHMLNISPSIAIRITFKDGSTDSKSTSMSARWDFKTEASSITGLSVTVDHEAL